MAVRLAACLAFVETLSGAAHFLGFSRCAAGPTPCPPAWGGRRLVRDCPHGALYHVLAGTSPDRAIPNPTKHAWDTPGTHQAVKRRNPTRIAAIRDAWEFSKPTVRGRFCAKYPVGANWLNPLEPPLKEVAPVQIWSRLRARNPCMSRGAARLAATLHGVRRCVSRIEQTWFSLDSHPYHTG